MLYLTTSPLSLVTYHVTKLYQKAPLVYEDQSALEIRDLLLQGTFNKPLLLVIEASTDKAPSGLKQSKFNTAYICLKSIKHWQDLIEEKEWVRSAVITPEMHRQEFDKLRGLFVGDAADWFWQRFKLTPAKLEMELYHLFSLFQSSGERITIELLEDLYIGNSRDEFKLFIRHLGSPEGTKVLTRLNDQALWSLLIGSNNKPAYLYHYLVGKNDNGICPSLYHYLVQYQQAVEAGAFELKIGAVLFHEWVISVGLQKENKSLIFNPSIDKQEELKNLFEGI